MPFGGSSTSSTSSPFSQPLADIGWHEWKSAQPLLDTIGSQFLEALRTGGVNSFIPWMTRALDSSRMSASQGIEGVRQNLARTGLAGSSFGESELNQANIAAGEQANMTPAQMIMQFIQGAPGFAQGEANSGIGALSSAASTDYTTTSTPSFWDQFMQTFQAGGQFGSMAAGAFAGAPPGATP